MQRFVSMTRAYQLGYAAGLLRKYARFCPYEGSNSASMKLQLQWADGWFDGRTRRRSKNLKHQNLKRKNLKPRRSRTRWPRSEYARRRLEAALGEARA